MRLPTGVPADLNGERDAQDTSLGDGLDRALGGESTQSVVIDRTSSRINGVPDTQDEAHHRLDIASDELYGPHDTLVSNRPYEACGLSDGAPNRPDAAPDIPDGLSNGAPYITSSSAHTRSCAAPNITGRPTREPAISNAAHDLPVHNRRDRASERPVRAHNKLDGESDKSEVARARQNAAPNRSNGTSERLDGAPDRSDCAHGRQCAALNRPDRPSERYDIAPDRPVGLDRITYGLDEHSGVVMCVGEQIHTRYFSDNSITPSNTASYIQSNNDVGMVDCGNDFTNSSHGVRSRVDQESPPPYHCVGGSPPPYQCVEEYDQRIERSYPPNSDHTFTSSLTSEHINVNGNTDDYLSDSSYSSRSYRTYSDSSSGAFNVNPDRSTIHHQITDTGTVTLHPSLLYHQRSDSVHIDNENMDVLSGYCPSSNLQFYPIQVKKKSVYLTYILALFLGLVGGHHFYLNRPKFGTMYIFTAGLFGIGYIVDLVRVPWLVENANIELLHPEVKGQKHEADAYLLWLPPFGILGFHHFYMGNWSVAVIYMFTIGGFLFGWMVDFLLIRKYWLPDVNSTTPPMMSYTQALVVDTTSQHEIDSRYQVFVTSQGLNDERDFSDCLHQLPSYAEVDELGPDPYGPPPYSDTVV